MKKRHCSYSKKMQLAIANVWIVSLPIPLFSMQAGQLPLDQAPAESTPEQESTAQQQPSSISAMGPQALEIVEPIEKIGTQGNWVKKREWLIKAHEVTNEIQDIATQTEQVRKSFIDSYNEIDVTLDKYYQELGLDDGKIQGLFDNIKRYLEKKLKKERTSLEAAAHEKPDPTLQAKIESIEESIKPLKQQLSQLKLDMKSIEDLDRSLTDRIKRVDEQMASIQEESTKAKNITNQMWDIIDHNKAREQYYDLKLSILEKTKATNSYLKDDLFRDFGTVIGTIKTQIARTQDQIKKLEADGLFIKDRAQKIKDFKLKTEETQQKMVEEKKDIKKETPVQVQKPSNWLTKIYNFVFNIVKQPIDLILWIKERIVGFHQPQKTLIEKPEEKDQKQPAAQAPATTPLLVQPTLPPQAMPQPSFLPSSIMPFPQPQPLLPSK